MSKKAQKREKNEVTDTRHALTSRIGIDKKFQSFSFFCCSLCTEELVRLAHAQTLSHSVAARVRGKQKRLEAVAQAFHNLLIPALSNIQKRHPASAALP
jgi:hypothetical protein